MRELTKRCLSVLLAVAVVGAGTVAMVNLDQGPEPVQQYSPVHEGEAIAPIALYGAAVVGGTAAFYLADTVKPDQSELENADDYETHTLLYQTAAQQADSNAESARIYNNWMQDASTIATMEGKNAYIRALESQDNQKPSKSLAKAEATEAVNDWFAGRQVSYLNRHTAAVESWESIFDSAVTEANRSWAKQMWDWRAQKNSPNEYRSKIEIRNGSIDLVNGSSHEIQYWRVCEPDESFCENIWPVSGGKAYQMNKTSPDSGETYQQVEFYDQGDWRSGWENITSEHQSALTQVENTVDATYDQYRMGEIDPSQLVDPYLGARNYDPEGDYGTFSHRTLMSMGYSPPTNLSRTKEMLVEVDGQNRTGILMSDGLPANGTFEVGTEYNASKLSGPQYLQTSTEMLEIEDTFTIHEIRRPDGSTDTSGSVKYTNPEYTTSSVDELKALLEDYQRMNAEANARQDRVRENKTGGGGLLDFGGLGNSLPFGGAGVAVALGAIVVLGLVTRN